MGKINEVPSKIYVNALAIAGIPTAASIKVNVRRQEVNGDVEYMLINSIWRKPSEKPSKYPAAIICYFTYGGKKTSNYVTDYICKTEEDFNDFFGADEHSIAWCYLSDILPKGGLR